MTANQIAYQQMLETKRSNRAREEETNRSNLVREEETNRSNVANENLKRDSNTIQAVKVGTDFVTGTLKGVSHLVKK